MAKKSFEQALGQLEKIVEELEAGDLPLEKALKKFEEGVKHSQYCTERLDETEQRISLLLSGEGGEGVEKPFFADDTDGSQS